MSLEPNPRRNDYVGDGSTSVYDYDFPINDKTELLVKTLDSDYNVDTLVLDTDYSVSGVEDENGGSITLLVSMIATPLESGTNLIILGRLPIEQQNDIGNQGSFRPDVIEDEFDNLSKVDQEQQEQIGRSIKIPDSIPVASFDPTLPPSILDPANALKPVIINATNNGLDLGEASGGGGGSGTGGNIETFLTGITTDQSIDVDVRNYYCDTSGGDVELTFPSASSVPGYVFEVFNIDDGGSNDVNVVGGITDIITSGESRVYRSNGVEFRASI